MYYLSMLLLKILTLFSALNISVNTTHPEIPRQARLKCDTIISRTGHEISFEKVTGP